MVSSGLVLTLVLKEDELLFNLGDTCEPNIQHRSLVYLPAAGNLDHWEKVLSAAKMTFFRTTAISSIFLVGKPWFLMKVQEAVEGLKVCILKRRSKSGYVGNCWPNDGIVKVNEYKVTFV